MKPTLCSRCKKNVAVVFITRLDPNGQNSHNEGLCLKCARELNIRPVTDMIEKMGLSDEELEGLTNEMMSAFDGTESMQDLIGNITESLRDVAGERDDDEDEEEGRTATFPFLNRLMGNMNGQEEKKDETPAPSAPQGGKDKAQGRAEKPDRKARTKRKFLENHCISLTRKAAEGKLDKMIGRDQELERVIQILNRRQKNNPCLIGEPGVGKTAIAEGLAMKIFQGDVPYKLKDKEVYLLDLTSLVAGTQFRGQFESRMKGLIEEIKKLGNIILVIDEVHNLVGAGDAEGSMNAANILKPALSRGEIQVIGATTLVEYRKYIEKDSALERRFQPVIVNEPSIEDAVEIIKGVAPYYEEFHHVKISPDIARLAVLMSERYITDRFLPDKAIDLIDEACAMIRTEMDSMPTELDVISRKIIQMEIEEAALKNQDDELSKARLQELQKELAESRDSFNSMKAKWENEKNAIGRVQQLREQIDEIEGAIAELKWQRGENFTIKQMEKTRKSLEARLDKLLAADKKDDVITFEQLGVDRLFVDESHAFKNLFLYTKMRNVAGLSTSEAQKSSDMFMKCRYMDELTGGRGVIFATGTPVSNSMTELYTVMRYLQYSTLQQKNLTHFDSWASTFGETTTAIELAPEGTGYRARTRFAKFFNLPELMNMFKEVADIKTSDQLHLPVPEAKFETVVVQPSEYQKDMVASLSERAADVHAGIVDPSVDNMLKITSDGRKLGLDQRLMNTLLPDDPDSKLNACVGNILRIWQDGQADKLTQLVFCDLSTPKNDGTFNVYDDVKTKLIANGVPAEEVAFIHDADTEAKKKDLFAKVRTGQVRVLLGSTQKMGAGTNVQDKLVAVHHLDVGWRPSDMTQRNGRIIRQGNRNKEVQVYQYVTEGTFDAYLYQTLENKQKFISQIMTSKSPVRSCDDVDEQALSYAEIKALCAGNPLIKEKMDLDIDVARLKVLKADHQSQQYRMEDKLLKYFPAEIEKQTGYIHGFEADIKTVEAHPQIADGFCGMEIMGKAYTEKADAGEILLAACKDTKSADPVPLGSYRGFQMELSFDSFRNEFDVTLKGAVSHRVALGTDARGNITRLDNALAGILERLERANEQLNNLYNQQEAAKAEVGKPFPQEAELTAKSQRLAELDAALNMEDSVENRDERSESERPSVLADLKSKAEHIPPAKYSETREEVL